MAATSSANVVRNYVRKQYIEPARRKGEHRVQIVAGDVHRALRLKNRVPNVCNALTSKTLLRENGLAIERQEGPPSGMSTRTTYTYILLDTPSSQGAKAGTFDELRGLLKDAFRSLGGGEAFLRKERSSFYRPGDGADR